MAHNSLHIGSDYESVKSLFGNVQENLSGSLQWFTVNPKTGLYGMFPHLQVTAKGGVVTEILAMPDWGFYKELGIVYRPEAAENVWDGCVSYMLSTYGMPEKEKEGKKIWNVNGTKIKVIIEGDEKKDVTVLIG